MPPTKVSATEPGSGTATFSVPVGLKTPPDWYVPTAPNEPAANSKMLDTLFESLNCKRSPSVGTLGARITSGLGEFRQFVQELSWDCVSDVNEVIKVEEL